MVEKNPNLKYKRVCVDRKFLETIPFDYQYWEVNDLDIKKTFWEPYERENPQPIDVIVIGNYQTKKMNKWIDVENYDQNEKEVVIIQINNICAIETDDYKTTRKYDFTMDSRNKRKTR